MHQEPNREQLSKPRPSSGQTGSRQWRLRSRLLVKLLLFSAGLGLLGIFGIPASTIFIASAILFALFLLIKLIRDNLRLFRSARVGWKRCATAFLISALVALPIFVVMLPGFVLQGFVTRFTEAGISHLQAWSAPEIDLKKTFEPRIKTVQKEVTKRIDNKVHWYQEPLKWVNVIPDYKEIVEFETAQITESIERTTQNIIEKPLLVRAISSALRTTLLALSTYSLAYLIAVGIRSYSAILGRILVVGEPPLSIAFSRSPTSRDSKEETSYPGKAQVFSGPSYQLKLPEGGRFFVKGGHNPDNAPENIRSTRRNGSSIYRLRHRVLMMHVVEGEADKTFTFRAPAGHNFIAIVLNKGESLILNPNYFIGFSSTVRFRTRLDFNLALLSLHSPSYLVASGPGMLLFQCPGTTDVSYSAEKAPSKRFEKFLAWGADASFHVEGSPGYFNYLLSSCNMKPATGRFFASAPLDGSPSSTRKRLWKLIKTVYLPI